MYVGKLQQSSLSFGASRWPHLLHWAPLAWVFSTVVGDVVHVVLHWCAERQGSPLLRRLGYIHTCHHCYIDAYANVDRAHFWCGTALLMAQLCRTRSI